MSTARMCPPKSPGVDFPTVLGLRNELMESAAAIRNTSLLMLSSGTCASELTYIAKCLDFDLACGQFD